MAPRTVDLASTALSSATYDDGTETLSITFTNGKTYDFEGVPERVFLELADAPSPGTYYNTFIKGVYG